MRLKNTYEKYNVFQKPTENEQSRQKFTQNFHQNQQKKTRNLFEMSIEKSKKLVKSTFENNRMKHEIENK